MVHRRLIPPPSLPTYRTRLHTEGFNKMMVISVVGLIVCVSSVFSSTSMDISAYEYQRKFDKTLSLGECPYRQVAVNSSYGNGTLDIQEERCTLHQKGVARNEQRAMNNSRNELIKTPSEVVTYLGLCGGDAASYLGLLHTGDCVAVEIASRLTFSSRTVVRAFIGYYRTSLDTLINPGVRPGMETYYTDKYYVRDISYGTLELILVQMRFHNNSQTAAARNVTNSDPKMSEYMKRIEAEVGQPKAVTMISLSTASNQKYKSKHEKQWLRALRYVEILELKIKNTRREITHEINNPPHLKYTLVPFLFKGTAKTITVKTWKEASMMAVRLQSAMHIVKRMARYCKKHKKTKTCRSFRQLRRNIKTHQAQIHTGRSAWINMSVKEKDKFIEINSKDIGAYTKEARKLTKVVRMMRRKEKRKRLSQKRSHRNRANQIPRIHRVRHRDMKMSSVRYSKSLRGWV